MPESPKRFCLFVGYPASGHSLVGAIIDAHRNAIVSHELHAARLIWRENPSRERLFRRIAARARKQAPTRSSANHSGAGRHRYDFHHLSQGHADDLLVIGDKRGGGTALLAARVGGWELVAHIRACVRLPLRVFLVTRNPYDMVVARRGALRDVVTEFERFSAGTKQFLAALSDDEIIRLRHEQMVASPRETIVQTCSFLDLEPYPEFVDTCSAAVFSRTTDPRFSQNWAPNERALVEEVLIDRYPWFAGYTFDGAY